MPSRQLQYSPSHPVYDVPDTTALLHPCEGDVNIFLMCIPTYISLQLILLLAYSSISDVHALVTSFLVSLCSLQLTRTSHCNPAQLAP